MKKKISRIISIMLVIAMLFTVAPLNDIDLLGEFTQPITAEAAGTSGGVARKIKELQASYKYPNKNNKIFFSYDNYKHECTTSNCPNNFYRTVHNNPNFAAGKNWSMPPGCCTCNAYAKYAYHYVFGEYPKISNAKSGTNYVAGISTKSSSNAAIAQFFNEKVHVGDILCYRYAKLDSNFRKNNYFHHFVMVTSIGSSSFGYTEGNGNGGAVLVNGSRTYSGLYNGNAQYSISDVYVCHAKNWNKVNSTNISVTKCQTYKVSNIAGHIKATISEACTVDTVGAFISTNKSAVSNINGTVASNHKSTGNVDYFDYNKNVAYNSVVDVVFNNNGKYLEADTTYYYRVVLKIAGSWYQSGVYSFTTTNEKPDKPNVSIAKDSQQAAIGQQVNVLWTGSNLATSYSLRIKSEDDNSLDITKTGLQGTTYVLDGIEKPGKYSVSITAVNNAGSIEGNTAYFTVMPDIPVTFVDGADNDAVIGSDTIHYGAEPVFPKAPIHEGHSFSGWEEVKQSSSQNMDDEYEAEKLVYRAKYDVYSYNVKFVDGMTKEVIKTENVKYNTAAPEPDHASYDGYLFVGWDKPIDKITEDTVVTSVYRWNDEDHPATVNIDSVKRNTVKNGYDIKVTVNNKKDEIISGRVVAVLRSANGTMLTSVDSAAFAVDAASDINGTEKTLTVTVLYPDFAAKAEVYVINAFDTLGRITETDRCTIDNSTSDAWSGWIEYTGDEPPVKETDTVKVETSSDIRPEKKYYRYKVRETTVSSETSLAGYIQDPNPILTKTAEKKIYYVTSWPSGFVKSNYYYTKYSGVTPLSNYDTPTEKLEVTETGAINGYIYWHWCRGENLNAAYNRTINETKTSTYKAFHAFSLANTELPPNPIGNAYKMVYKSVCGDSYWWFVIPVRRQVQTYYSKSYKYYRDSEFTDWIEYEGDEIPVKVDDVKGSGVVNEVETRTEEAVNVKYYRYRNVDNAEIAEPEVSDARKATISGKVDSSLAGKNASVWVYKYDQASNVTTEFVGDAKVASDGTIAFDAPVALKEEPTEITGDFTIVAAVDGQQKAIEIGKIEAPKHKYTVKFFDYNGKEIENAKQTVTEGENAKAPSRDSLNIPAGKRFLNWSESFVNVRSNMEIRPETEDEIFTVAFVNWEVQTVSFKKFRNGSSLVADSIPDGKEGFNTEWVIEDENGEYETIDEFNESGKTVNKDLIVVTRSTPVKYTVTVVKLDPHNAVRSGADAFDVIEKDDPEEPQKTTTTVLSNGSKINFSEIEEPIENDDTIPDIIFLGWMNTANEEYVEDTTVTENMIIYPVYIFPDTANTPVADIEQGEYTTDQTVTLTAESASGATPAIFYTIDKLDGSPVGEPIEYKEPIVIDSTCVLTAFTSEFGCNDSEELSVIYAINKSGKIAKHIITVDSSNITEENYNSNALSAMIVSDGSKLKNVEWPTIEGYSIEGIYMDPDYSERFDVDQEVVDHSMTLYVKYKENIFDVDFVYLDAADQEVLIEKKTVKYGDAIEAPAAPAIDGKVFTGWDTDLTKISVSTKVTAKYIDEADYAEVKLNRHNQIVISQGSKFTKLTASVTPADIGSAYDLVWTSDDEKVATVDENGIITGVGVGITTITVTMPYTGSTDSCKVKVMNNPEEYIILNDSATAGFDSERNLRNVRASTTVGDLLAMFVNEGLKVVDSNGNEMESKDSVGTGCKVVLAMADGTELDSVVVIVVGDVNGDKRVNSADVTLISGSVLETVELTRTQCLAGDVNGDGRVNNRDSAVLMQYIVGKNQL